jgi:hypothetical protein
MTTVKIYWQEGYPTRHSWNIPNTLQYWAGMDSEEHYRKNPHPDFTETSITYSYNSFGFRTHEFNFENTENNILCFGCSHTEGIAVQDPWPVLLQQKLPQYTIYNLGHGSGSSDTVARLITNYVPLLKPKKVFILWPSMTRYELYDNKVVHHIGPWHEHKEAINLLTDENIHNWTAKNKIYVQMYSRIYNFELYEDQEINWLGYPKLLDKGRDHAHPGPKTHEAIAQFYFNQAFETNLQ